MKKGFKIIGKSSGIRKQKKETKEQDRHYSNQRPDVPNDVDDSDYEDSHRLGMDEAESNVVEVYVDTEDDETDQNIVGNPNSYDTGVAVISPTSGRSQQQQQFSSTPEPAPAPAVVAPVSEAQVEKAVLSDKERKARARKAVQDRKNKSRLDIAARNAAKNDTNANTNTKEVTPNNNNNSNEEVRRRALSEERHKLIELERQQEQEEREQLEKEEAEMKKLEEALKKEEEEAKKLAEQYDDAIKETVVMETVDSYELNAEVEAGLVVLEAIKETVVEETVDSYELNAEVEAGLVVLEEEENSDDVAIKETVVVETVDAYDLNAEVEAGLVVLEEEENSDDVDAEAEKAKLEAEFKELAKQELEVERIRAEELAELQAEVEENARLREAEKKTEDLLNQFVTLDEEDNRIEHVGDVNHRDIALIPDLDDLLDGSLSYNESSILDDAIDGPIVFTEPAASKPNDKKKETTKVAAPSKPKPKTASTKPGLKATVQKPPGRVNVSKIKKPDKKSTSVLPRVVKKQPNKKPNPSVTKSPKPWRNSFTKKANKKEPPVVSSKPIKQHVTLFRVAKKQPPVVSKPLKKPVLKPMTKPSISKKPNKKPPVTKPLKPVLPRVIKQQKPLVSKAPTTPVQSIIRKQPSITNMSHLRTPTNNRGPKIKESPSMDSMGSHCTFNSVPRSPYGKHPPDMLMCKNNFIVKLHVKPMGCQVCIFKLSEAEKDEYEKHERHLRVATTCGGCADCAIFPSAVEEDPVRLCKKCFFDTHLVRAKEDDAFGGSGALAGVQRNYGTYGRGAYNPRTPTPY